MVRSDLCVTVPSLFRCPISLDVMKSPVSLCTGVTYDRSSIERWLESGHDTCPATMQVLPSKDFVPNLTLHRLINLWSQSSSLRPDFTASPAISRQQVRVLINGIRNGSENSRDCLCKIVEFGKSCDENRSFLASFDGFVDLIVGGLSRDCVEIEVLELAIRALDLVMCENGIREQTHKLIFNSNKKCLPSILSILRNGTPISKIESARVLESIALDAESKRAIAEHESLLSVLVHLVTSATATATASTTATATTDSVLSCLIAISITHSTKSQLVRFGLVQTLSKTLSNPNTSIPTTEKALKLLSMLSTCTDARLAISEDPKCAAAVVEKLMKVSKSATADAVTVVWSMCCLERDVKVKEAVVKSNGVTKILLVMQSELGCEGNTRKMCVDLVKVLRVGCKSGLGRYETKSIHIMPC